jgi:uncharacterized protein (TIGR02145 family)
MFKVTVIISFIFLFGTVTAQQNTFKDSRDGNVYTTVKIGNQIWMCENLRYNADGAMPFDNNEDNITTNGYLYDWETAQDICPEGWHLPNDEEWNELITFLGGKNKAGGKLKSNLPDSGWNAPNRFATNSSGFNAIPSGFSQGGEFLLKGKSAYFWSSEAECTSAYTTYLSYMAGFVDIKVLPKTDMAAIRCIKD